MNPRTGDLYMISAETHEAFESLAKEARLVPIDASKADGLARLSKGERKNWMRNQSCQCGSGKKFKRCCWSKFA